MEFILKVKDKGNDENRTSRILHNVRKKETNSREKAIQEWGNKSNHKNKAYSRKKNKVAFEVKRTKGDDVCERAKPTNENQ